MILIKLTLMFQVDSLKLMMRQHYTMKLLWLKVVLILLMKGEVVLLVYLEMLEHIMLGE